MVRGQDRFASERDHHVLGCVPRHYEHDDQHGGLRLFAQLRPRVRIFEHPWIRRAVLVRGNWPLPAGQIREPARVLCGSRRCGFGDVVWGRPVQSACLWGADAHRHASRNHLIRGCARVCDGEQGLVHGLKRFSRRRLRSGQLVVVPPHRQLHNPAPGHEAAQHEDLERSRHRPPNASGRFVHVPGLLPRPELQPAQRVGREGACYDYRRVPRASPPRPVQLLRLERRKPLLPRPRRPLPPLDHVHGRVPV
mmetsp:Transcript_4033/g.7064  ORF Transcript_4033/g.7064 Transcript_4033/m.7064 type:complete len:251 (-) Transcript_4033:2216-2968(-)